MRPHIRRQLHVFNGAKNTELDSELLNGYHALDNTQRDLAPGCLVQNHQLVRRTVEEIDELRQELSETLSAKLLRQADEQTVVGLASVIEAVGTSSNIDDFEHWGLVAAPKYLGRVSAAITIYRHRRKGISAVSPSFVPQFSLHSVAGGISVSLGIHGPSFGVGGGPCAAREGLLTAVSLAAQGELPGVWLVLSEWESEPTPDGATRDSLQGLNCVGLAVALKKHTASVKPGQGTQAQGPDDSAPTPAQISENITVAEVAAMLDANRSASDVEISSPDEWPHRKAA